MSDIAWLRDVIYCLPLAALIWKAASLHADVKHLKEDVTKNIQKFCTEHKELEQSVNSNKLITDRLMQNINDKLTAIQVSVARIEAKTESKQDED